MAGRSQEKEERMRDLANNKRGGGGGLLVAIVRSRRDRRISIFQNLYQKFLTDPLNFLNFFKLKMFSLSTTNSPRPSLFNGISKVDLHFGQKLLSMKDRVKQVHRSNQTSVI